ncbi:MAG: LysM peptidoglycan-binding domain-containing protein [Acinetobacter sp.]|nr:MAG: LysM peptidoglycan-binding domain-containing protein [Acinetobacter sp.]
MRRIVLTLLSFLAFFSAQAQNPVKAAQSDSLLKKITSATPDTVPVPVVKDLLFYNQNLTYKLRLDSIQKTVPLSYNEYVQNFIGLNMDNFVDERKDPIQASYAAAAYFRDAYEELGDWLLAIAAYNCGKGNVTRAIDKAGSRDFWEIRKFLPKETRDYVPAFIAAVYLMNYSQTHGIVSQAPSINLKTDTIQVNHFVALADIAKAINYDESTLYGLNPSYKKKIVNGTIGLPKRLILPRIDQNDFAKLYDVLNNDVETERSVYLASTDDVRDLRKKVLANKVVITKPKSNVYKVKPGQNLTIIADLFNVEVQDLKVWNELKSNTVIPGQTLKIHGSNSAPIAKAIVKPEFITYKVKAGDTLSGIAEKFDGATVASIKKTNGLKKAALQPGMVLKIKS